MKLCRELRLILEKQLLIQMYSKVIFYMVCGYGNFITYALNCGKFVHIFNYNVKCTYSLPVIWDKMASRGSSNSNMAAKSYKVLHCTVLKIQKLPYL